jgi:hypothetical protein
MAFTSFPTIHNADQLPKHCESTCPMLGSAAGFVQDEPAMREMDRYQRHSRCGVGWVTVHAVLKP